MSRWGAGRISRWGAGRISRRGAGRASRPREKNRASLVGRDLARMPMREGRRGWLAPAVLGLLIAALGLVALRTELIRVRYALAEAMQQEKSLQEEHREFTARARQLRDPARLAQRSRELGFVRPERVIDLVASGGRP